MLTGEVIDIVKSFKTQKDKEGRDLPLGTIQIRFGGSGGPREEKLAYPINNMTQTPLKGEHVLLVQAPSFLAHQNVGGLAYYYISVINIHGNKHLNPLPDMYKADNKGGEPSYAASAGPIVQDSDEYTPGENFIESDQVKNHQPFEGDLLLEGRHSQVIRFSSGIEGDTGQYDNIPYWEGRQGSPILCFSNGSPREGGPNKFIIDNPDDTDCSILLVGKDITLTKFTLSQGIGPSTPMGSYKSPQVTINSDRLIFNSKVDEIILSAKTDVVIATPNWAAEMDIVFTILDDLLGSINKVFTASAPFPTPTGGATLPNPEAGTISGLITKLASLKQ